MFGLSQISCDLDVWFIPNQLLIWMVLIKKFRPWKEREIAVDSKLGVAPICMVEKS
jgi:hypothetical protein